MVTFTGPPSGAIRNKPISAQLKVLLEAAARAAGIDEVRITSGGQDALGEGTRRTGSTRHDRGRAADIQLVTGSAVLSFTDQSAPLELMRFCTAAAAAGATGIGAGVAYMGNRTIHVGFGTSVDDTSKLTWGAGGRSTDAPPWLRDAAKSGWTSPPAGPPPQSAAARSPGRYVVVARDGLKLRGGPGTNFVGQRTLAAGTELTVSGFSDTDPAWASVNLEEDDLIDGYVFASFLARHDPTPTDESVPEPDAAENA